MGQVIAIVDAYHDPNALSDLNNFNSEFGYPTLSTCATTPPFTTSTGACFYQADPQGMPATNSDWILEESLDIEWAHAEAPGATIVLVEAETNATADLMNAVSWANDNGATELSMSWETSEFATESSYDSNFDATSTSTGLPILYTAATGDSGHGAAYPAASPNVLGVGGTTLNGCDDTSCSAFSSETGWSDSGGGVSKYERIPAYQSGYGGPVSSEPSGGISSLTGGMRGTPDVSFDANPSTGVSVYDSTTYDCDGNCTAESGWFTLGGTSVGAPNWAGILAAGASSAASLQGAPDIYGSGYASYLRDITSGSNGSCGTDCTAGTGYDLVTGLGSPLGYPPPPTVTNLSPASGSTSGGTVVSITGANFLAAGTTVDFGTSPATDVSVTSDTELTAVSPMGSGTVSVTVTTPDGVSQANAASQFGYVVVPPYPAVGVYPNWLTAGSGNPPASGTQSASNVIRGAGSVTTLFMMQQIGDLYTDAGLYGCQLVSSGPDENADCDNTKNEPPSYSDIATTDTVDNFDRTEVLQGVNDVGSLNGENQLCDALSTPQPVDFARSSGPASSIEGCNMVGLGFAKDSIPALDFQEINPEAVGTPIGYAGANFGGVGTGDPNNVAFPTGGIGPVAAGWLPGDPYTCVPAGEHLEGIPCSGVPFSDVDNTGGATSVAYRLWCAPLGSGRITDWGQLTNLNVGTLSSPLSTGSPVSSLPVDPLSYPLTAGTITVTSGSDSQSWTASAAAAGATGIDVSPQTPSVAFPAGSTVTTEVGNGTPIGVPIRIVGVNPGSGTEATFSSFADSGVAGGGCSSSTVLADANAAQGPDPVTPVGLTGNTEISVENDASQIGTYAAADYPNDAADQAVEIATSLYFESFGVNLSNPNAGTASLSPGSSQLPGGVPLTYTGTVLDEDGVTPTIPHERTNTFPTSMTLSNSYNANSLRASTAGFLNWICDSNSAFAKGIDLATGQNFDAEITNIVNDDFEFSRLNDDTSELPSNAITPADGVQAPNSSCDASLSVTANGTNSVTMASGSVPSPQAFVVGQEVLDNTPGVVPPGTTVHSVGTDTITFNNAIASVGQITMYFPGIAPILTVTSPNS